MECILFQNSMNCGISEFDIIDSIYQQKRQHKAQKYAELCEKAHANEEFINSIVEWIIKLLYQEQYWEEEKYTFHFSFKINFDETPVININEKYGLTKIVWNDLIANHYDKINSRLPIDQFHLVMGNHGIFGYPRNRSVKDELETLRDLDKKISDLESKLF